MKIKFKRIRGIHLTFSGNSPVMEVDGDTSSDEEVLIELCNRNGDAWAARTMMTWGPKSQQAVSLVVEEYQG